MNNSYTCHKENTSGVIYEDGAISEWTIDVLHRRLTIIANPSHPSFLSVTLGCGMLNSKNSDYFRPKSWKEIKVPGWEGDRVGKEGEAVAALQRCEGGRAGGRQLSVPQAGDRRGMKWWEGGNHSPWRAVSWHWLPTASRKRWASHSHSHWMAVCVFVSVKRVSVCVCMRRYVHCTLNIHNTYST